MRNGGKWTEAKFNSFVKSALRSASQRWPPKYETLNEAFVEKRINPSSGRVAKFFKCSCCGNEFLQKDIEVNHKEPVVPITGFDNWSNVIERMFCEKDGLEAVCKPCHKLITKRENEERKLIGK